MVNFEFSVPTKIVFGAGEAKRTGELAAKFGKKALLVTYDESLVKQLGFFDKVADSCKRPASNCSATSASRVTRQPNMPHLRSRWRKKKNRT